MRGWLWLVGFAVVVTACGGDDDDAGQDCSQYEEEADAIRDNIIQVWASDEGIPPDVRQNQGPCVAPFGDYVQACNDYLEARQRAEDCRAGRPVSSSEPECSPGTETCPCLGGDVCAIGLTCASGICVVVPGGGTYGCTPSCSVSTPVCCDNGDGTGIACHPTADRCRCTPGSGSNPCDAQYPLCCDTGDGNGNVCHLISAACQAP